jgi:5-methylcytosine-specific restriction endonuclease McrA
MPCDYNKYPSNWKTEIRPAILERADSCCEFCGVANHKVIERSKVNPAVYRYAEDDNETVAGRRVGVDTSRQIRVVLTIAHLDHDKANNAPENLAALCQRCHLRWDARLHAINAANTRKLKGT